MKDNFIPYYESSMLKYGSRHMSRQDIIDLHEDDLFMFMSDEIPGYINICQKVGHVDGGIKFLNISNPEESQGNISVMYLKDITEMGLWKNDLNWRICKMPTVNVYG